MYKNLELQVKSVDVNMLNNINPTTILRVCQPTLYGVEKTYKLL